MVTRLGGLEHHRLAPLPLLLLGVGCLAEGVGRHRPITLLARVLVW